MSRLDVAAFALLALLPVTCTPPMQKHVVTLPLARLTGEQRELTFAVCGRNRLEALVNSGVTVWTQEEWALFLRRSPDWEKK